MKGWLTKYQHVERLGSEDVEGLLDGEVVVQEKLDGANATVALVDSELTLMSRNRVLAPDESFNGLREYVEAHDGIRELLDDFAPDVALRGEWLVKHTLPYPPEAYRKFYVYDIEVLSECISCHGTGLYLGTEDCTRCGTLGRAAEYLPWTDVERECSRHGVPFVPVIATLANPTAEELAAYLPRKTFLWTPPPEFNGDTSAAQEAEGIVIKQLDYVNRYGRTQWGKLVTADFKERARTPGVDTSAPLIDQLVARITRDLVAKSVAKAAVAREEPPQIRHMPHVMGLVWHDAFHEELWQLAKRGGTLDMRAAKRAVDDAARQHALAIYNSVG